jgi:ribosomal-protein-alanine N-acetyltransferase
MFTDATVRRFLGGPLSQSEASERIQIPGRRWGFFAVELGDELIGTVSCSLKRGLWELSFQIVPSHWRRGYATEAARAVASWFFAHTEEDALHANAQSANAGSLGVLQRIGGRETARWMRDGNEVVGFSIPRVSQSELHM